MSICSLVVVFVAARPQKKVAGSYEDISTETTGIHQLLDVESCKGAKPLRSTRTTW